MGGNCPVDTELVGRDAHASRSARAYRHTGREHSAARALAGIHTVMRDHAGTIVGRAVRMARGDHSITGVADRSRHVVHVPEQGEEKSQQARNHARPPAPGRSGSWVMAAGPSEHIQPTCFARVCFHTLERRTRL